MNRRDVEIIWRVESDHLPRRHVPCTVQAKVVSAPKSPGDYSYVNTAGRRELRPDHLDGAGKLTAAIT